MKTILTVPAKDQSIAVTLGAMLDPKSGQYFALAGIDLAVFRAWLPAQIPFPQESAI